MEHRNQLREIFLRYLDNRCSPQEIRQLLQYFGTEDRERLYALIEEQLARPVNPGFEHSPRGKALFEKIHREIQKTVRTDRKSRGLRKLWPQIAAAAAIAVFAGLGWGYRDTFHNWIDPVEIQYVNTQSGQRQQFQLADGSMIWLGPESSLRYPDAFRGAQREVTLTGEAFFEVSPDKDHPFVIRTGEVSTTVLGTSFNIQAYEKDLSVTVVTGRVRVVADEKQQEGAEVLLNSDQRAVFDAETKSLVREEAPDASAMQSRREGIFEYRGTPVENILSDMAREYGLALKTEGRLVNCTFYGTKKPEDDVYHFLEKVALTVNATIRKEENTVYFKGNGCGAM
ncbi:FecR family protein [Sinomicrobium soli]|uniref:FecR family protein n=1 Tax=Sinomicrobium sp. N-1-3-6 TaxID=2219864 RepID=UPI00137512EA|nr:FecR family protein [Sinomicrobium sp. N-1-3-6]